MVTISGGGGLERALADIASRIGGSKTVLKVGFLEGATYPEDEGGLPVAQVAFFNEYGTTRPATAEEQNENGGLLTAVHTPARPFFRNMIDAKSGEWGPALGKALKANGYDVEAAMSLVGEGIKGQLQQSIRDMDSPANAESTVKAKGFDDPLINSGHMVNSVDYEVSK